MKIEECKRTVEITKNERNDTMTQLPKDPVMLLSYLNTQLRDNYSSLEELCSSLQLNMAAVCEKLAAIDYTYDPSQNQFI